MAFIHEARRIDSKDHRRKIKSRAAREPLQMKSCKLALQILKTHSKTSLRIKDRSDERI